MTDRCFVVLDPGPLTTVQDRGRPGWAHLGVPRGGALDLSALELANRLVGNDAGAAGLETTLGGVTVELCASMSVAVTGARAPVLVDGRAVSWGEPLSLRAGQRLTVGAATTGLRSYVAFAGGVDVPPVLGSRAHDTLSGTGPAPLVEGDEVPVGTATGVPAGVDVPAPMSGQVGAAVVGAVRGAGAVLRFRPGPRADWFTDGALAALTGAAYTVSAQSNRIGLRLEGPPLERARRGELASEGVVLGAVQVPASGAPLVFLNDHPVTGGYPVVGVVDAGDLGRCAQLRPGDEVRFRAC